MIFLYGDDIFRSRRKLLEIKQKYAKSDKSGSGLSVFDCEEEKSAGEKIINVMNTGNLLAPKRLLIVKNGLTFLSDEEQDKILNYLEKNKKNVENDKNTVAIFWEGGMPKKNNKLFKFLDKNSKKQNFEKLTGIKLAQWALKILKEINPLAKISKSALDKLTAYCAENNFLLFHEMQKLANYAENEMINEAEVELLVKANLGGNIFRTIDALGTGDKKEALKLLHNHLEKGDDPFYLLAMFSHQFRNMLKVADLKENENMNEYEISKTAKLHPFVVKKSLAQIRNFPLAHLKEIYRRLSELDLKVKTGKIDIKLALDKFIAEL